MESNASFEDNPQLIQKKIANLEVDLQVLKSKKRKLEIREETKPKKLLPPINTSYTSNSASRQSKITNFFNGNTTISSITNHSQLDQSDDDQLEIISNKDDIQAPDLQNAEEEIYPLADTDVFETNNVSATQAKEDILWSADFRAKVSNLLNKKTIVDVHNQYSGRIPIRTLYFWKRFPSKRQNCGRRPEYEDLEEHLFEWFLMARARKIAIKDVDLKRKAEKIAIDYSTRALASSV
jgi:hypothetical protein